MIEPLMPKTAKLVQDHLMKGEVQWIALDSFRVWTKEVTRELDGYDTLEITCQEFVIKEVVGKKS